MSKRLGGIKGCKYKTSSWHLNRFPDADNIGLLSFLTFSALVASPKKNTLHSGQSRYVVVVVSHIQRIGCQPEKNYFTQWPIPLVVC